MASYLKVKLLYGGIARDKRQKATLQGLGLRRRNQERVLKNTPAIRGMIQKVFDLVKFEETGSAQLSKPAKIETYKLGAVSEPVKKKAKVKAVSKEASEDQKPKKAPAKKVSSKK